MKLKSIQLLLFSVLLVFAGVAWAAATYSCNISTLPNNYSQTYSGLSNSSTSLSLSITCIKTGNGGALTINYTVTPSNGLWASGAQNRAALSGNFINYDIYTDATCTTAWSGTGSMAMPGGGPATITQALTYFGCVPMAQPGLPPPATYGDTVTMTLATTTAGVTITGTNPAPFTVSVIVPAVCTISTLPGTVAFTYTAFSAVAVAANTTFQSTCSNLLPYTMSLDATTDVVGGLNYSLALNTSGTGGVHPLASTGTGAAQTFYINGTMPAGQAGTCATASCLTSQVRTLTITY
ncbi:MAG: spore coat U domain-containing protein [Gallionella sp.]|nr:spore coat U domain-containing protein [Gallionella sp.]